MPPGLSCPCWRLHLSHLRGNDEHCGMVCESSKFSFLERWSYLGFHSPVIQSSWGWGRPVPAARNSCRQEAGTGSGDGTQTQAFQIGTQASKATSLPQGQALAPGVLSSVLSGMSADASDWAACPDRAGGHVTPGKRTTSLLPNHISAGLIHPAFSFQKANSSGAERAN